MSDPVVIVALLGLLATLMAARMGTGTQKRLALLEHKRDAYAKHLEVSARLTEVSRNIGQVMLWQQLPNMPDEAEKLEKERQRLNDLAWEVTREIGVSAAMLAVYASPMVGKTGDKYRQALIDRIPVDLDGTRRRVPDNEGLRFARAAFLGAMREDLQESNAKKLFRRLRWSAQRLRGYWRRRRTGQ